MNSIETKRIVYISNPNEKYQRMVTMNATDDYNCHVLALCPPLRMNAHPITYKPTYFHISVAQAFGGAISISDSTATLSGLVFTDCKAEAVSSNQMRNNSQKYLQIISMNTRSDQTNE